MNKLLLWLVIILPVFCVTCQKEVVESQRYPRVRTLDVADVTTEGATFRGDIISLGHLDIIEQGFIWDTIASLSYEYSEKIILKGTNHPGLFKQRINSSLSKNQTYFVKAFLRTKDYLVLGDVVDFLSKGSIPPAIKSISPNYGHWGDTVIIRGERFNSKSNIVLFGQIKANLIENSDTLLRVIVPSKKNDLKTTINFATPDGIVNTEALFNYLVPEISDFYPKSGTFGDLVEIEGAHLAGNFKSSCFVYFNESRAEVVEASPRKLKVRIPNVVESKELQLFVNVDGHASGVTAKFLLNPPEIESLSIHEGYITQTVSIVGKNFNPFQILNKVYFGNNVARLNSATGQILQVQVPDGVYDKRNVTMRVEVAGQETTYTHPFFILDPWLRRGNIPAKGQYSTYALCNFSHGLYGYSIILADQIDLWRFDPKMNQWVNLGNFPGAFRSGLTAFVIDDFAYVGGCDEKQDFWKYDIINNEWKQIADFPVSQISSLVSFAINGKGYVCTDKETRNFWQYDPTADVWSNQNDFSPENSFFAKADIGFSIDERGYILTQDGTTGPDELWQYSDDTKQWTKMADQRDNLFYSDRNVVIINNEAYLVPGAYDEIFYKYNPLSNNWFYVGKAIGRHQAISFAIENVGYVGGGYNFMNPLDDFWEYNPNPVNMER